MDLKRTKIICTIGPASESEKIMEQLIRNGANIFRFNLKHNSSDWHLRAINRAKKVALRLHLSLGIMVDTPDRKYHPAMEEADFVALSYLKEQKEISDFGLMIKKRKLKPKIISKIENGRALKSLAGISYLSQGVMIARGDLGREVPIEELGYWQKMIIEWCRQINIPVIVATEMLKSMTSNPSPTRAEATDVANAVFDGADALMLSEETALGNYPAATVAQMKRIIIFSENNWPASKIDKKTRDTRDIIINSAAMMARETSADIKGLIVFTQSGDSARIISTYRLAVPVVAVTDDRAVFESLNLSFGIIPFLKIFRKDGFKLSDSVFDEIKRLKVFRTGKIIIIHGNNWLSEGRGTEISLVDW